MSVDSFKLMTKFKQAHSQFEMLTQHNMMNSKPQTRWHPMCQLKYKMPVINLHICKCMCMHALFILLLAHQLLCNHQYEPARTTCNMSTQKTLSLQLQLNYCGFWTFHSNYTWIHHKKKTLLFYQNKKHPPEAFIKEMNEYL